MTRGVAAHQEAAREHRAQAMWRRYTAGQSLRQVGREFGVVPQTVHAIFRARGWVRRRLSEAQLLGSDRRPQRQLLATLVRLRTACDAMGIDPAEFDTTFAQLDPEAQARIRHRAQLDLIELLTDRRQQPQPKDSHA